MRNLKAVSPVLLALNHRFPRRNVEDHLPQRSRLGHLSPSCFPISWNSPITPRDLHRFASSMPEMLRVSNAIISLPPSIMPRRGSSRISALPRRPLSAVDSGRIAIVCRSCWVRLGGSLSEGPRNRRLGTSCPPCCGRTRQWCAGAQGRALIRLWDAIARCVPAAELESLVSIGP